MHFVNKKKNLDALIGVHTHLHTQYTLAHMKPYRFNHASHTQYWFKHAYTHTNAHASMHTCKYIRKILTQLTHLHMSGRTAHIYFLDQPLYMSMFTHVYKSYFV